MFDTIIAAQGVAAYLLVFSMLLAGALGLPMPEDLALISAGILVHSGKAHIIPMGLICYIGVLIGDLMIYRIGYVAGPTLFRKRWFRKYVTTSRLQWIRSNVERRNFLTILIARHLFYLRTATFLVCGAVRVQFTKFIVADLVAALVTVPLMGWIGYVFAEHSTTLFQWVGRAKVAILIGGLVLITLVVVWYQRQSRFPEEDDDVGEDEIVL